MENKFFWAEEEIDNIKNDKVQLFSNREEYKKQMTKFLLGGLRNLGYENTLQSLEKESGIEVPKIFDNQMKQYIKEKKFDSAIVYIKLDENRKNINDRNLNYINYELLKLKYVNCLINGDVIMGLFLLRNDLKNFPEFFEKEKNCLSKLYLNKSKEDITNIIKFDFEDEVSIENYINSLEFKILSNFKYEYKDPFENICKNSISYNLINCDYHIPGNFYNNDNNNNCLDYSIEQNHKCLLEYIPNNVFQKLEKVFCEIWKLKFSKDCKKIFGSGAKSFFCWELNPESQKYKMKWTNPSFEGCQINDWDINEKEDSIILVTSQKQLLIWDIKDGNLKTSVEKAHKDIINTIYVFKDGVKFLTGSVDGFLIVWDSKNYEKLYEIPTRRILSLVVTIDEKEVYIIYGNCKMIDKISLNEDREVIKYKEIIERDCILSSTISPNGKYLLLNIGQQLPELHLWRLSDGKLLNIYTGHTQSRFIIKSGFYTDNIIFSGSEDGYVYFWHINQSKYVKRIKLGKFPINDVTVGYNPVLKKKCIATASDDSQITIIY